MGVRDLPAGQAVRRVRRHALSAGEDRLPVVAVEHFVPVPGVAPTFLVVSGHTLDGPLEAAVVELFDTVVATLRWTGGTR
ncbi:hypothetical protein CLV37_10849 [Kineococcus rhizosphaerae]|uniref:Uncharacterized protein n=1 Tax=Kineococcus rhizosphaerae TaxID=559628 RepID=A0A2T0R1H6_9ACTN|nr:hypothetical protein CLV37_10849 [Kineococcus rhizosphaerae]